MILRLIFKTAFGEYGLKSKKTNLVNILKINLSVYFFIKEMNYLGFKLERVCI